MKAFLKALAAKLRLTGTAPAVAAEAEDVDAYSPEMAEQLINSMCDQLEATNARVRALASDNHALTAQLKAANIAISHLNKLPKNKFWNQRKGK